MADFGHFPEKGAKSPGFRDLGRGFYINPSPGSPDRTGPGIRDPAGPGGYPRGLGGPRIGDPGPRIRDPGDPWSPGPSGQVREASRGSPGVPRPSREGGFTSTPRGGAPRFPGVRDPGRHGAESLQAAAALEREVLVEQFIVGVRFHLHYERVYPPSLSYRCPIPLAVASAGRHGLLPLPLFGSRRGPRTGGSPSARGGGTAPAGTAGGRREGLM